MAKQQEVRFTLSARDQTGRGMSSAMQRMEKLKKASLVVITATAAAALAGAAALTRMTQSGLRTADATAKAARALQMTNAELRATELFAERAGVSSEQLTEAMSKLRVTVSNMSRGQGSDRLIREIGLDVQSLAKMKPAEQFAKITESLGNMSDRNRAAAISSELFRDRTGKLTNAILDQSGGLRDAIDDVEKYGLALNETDSAALENVNDQFTLLRKIVQSVNERFAVGMAPALESVNKLLLSTVGNTNMATNAGAFFADVMITGAEVAYQSWARLNQVVLLGQKAMLSAWSLLPSFMGTDFSDSISGAIEQVNSELAEIGKTLSGDSAVLKWYDEIQRRVLSLAPLVKTTGDEMTANMGATLQDLTSLVNSAGNTIETALTDAFMTGKLNAKEMVRSIIADIIKLMVQVSIIRPLFGAIGGAFGGNLGAAFTAYSTGGVPGRAFGGNVRSGDIKMVGENGPEAVMFGSNASILPNSSLGGQSTTINIDARNADMGVVDQLRAMFIAMDSNFDVRATAAVNHAMGRNPRIGVRA